MEPQDVAYRPKAMYTTEVHYIVTMPNHIQHKSVQDPMPSEESITCRELDMDIILPIPTTATATLEFTFA